MKHIPRLLLIVPCYNEEEVLPETIHRLTDMLALLKQQQMVSVGHILIVDDGSTEIVTSERSTAYSNPAHNAC